ncbi:hypothetical protein FSPOR_11073 [Fusarium sporotrichioides]|uniref:Uncharacterized protein n=1 Tax=Fusarium sporotrichioides TaxID=5514 RepID=A0A395RIX0_FUSSP|nr:hypothetical protein FSPOR_11073 [Fusarium sporotrichioides]
MSENTVPPINGENREHRKLKPLRRRPYTYIHADTHKEFQAVYEVHDRITLNLDIFWSDATKHVARRDSEGTPSCPNTSTKKKNMKPKPLESLQTPRVMPCDLKVRKSLPLGFRVKPIRPLLPEHMRALVKTFCDPSIRETMLNNPGLYNAKLYVRLGELSPPDEAKSTELCRPVYFDQHLRGARKDMKIRAKQMGAALAIIHCKCGYDGAGIKFQLGLRPKYLQVVMWPTNFARCKIFNVSQNMELKLALAIAKNPAWPRPPGCLLVCMLRPEQHATKSQVFPHRSDRTYV